MSVQEQAELAEISRKVGIMFDLLQGTQGQLGLLQKVEVMWRAHVWLLCAASAAGGSIGTLALKAYFLH